MMTKWRILLRTPLQVWLQNVGKVLICITRMHNFCNNEGCDITNTDEADDNSPAFVPPDASVTNVEGNSVLRDVIAWMNLQGGYWEGHRTITGKRQRKSKTVVCGTCRSNANQ